MQADVLFSHFILPHAAANADIVRKWNLAFVRIILTKCH